MILEFSFFFERILEFSFNFLFILRPLPPITPLLPTFYPNSTYIIHAVKKIYSTSLRKIFSTLKVFSIDHANR